MTDDSGAMPFSSLVLRALIFLLGCVCVLAWAYVMQQDVRLVLGGVATEGQVTQLREINQRNIWFTYVEYKFQTPDGETIESADRVALWWGAPEDRRVRVYYVKQSPTVCRLASNYRLVYWIVLGVGLGIAYHAIPPRRPRNPDEPDPLEKYTR